MPDLIPFVIKRLTDIDVGTYFAGGLEDRVLALAWVCMVRPRPKPRILQEGSQPKQETCIRNLDFTNGDTEAHRGQEATFIDHAVAEVQGESAFLFGPLPKPHRSLSSQVLRLEP